MEIPWWVARSCGIYLGFCICNLCVDPKKVGMLLIHPPRVSLCIDEASKQSTGLHVSMDGKSCPEEYVPIPPLSSLGWELTLDWIAECQRGAKNRKNFANLFGSPWRSSGLIEKEPHYSIDSSQLSIYALKYTAIATITYRDYRLMFTLYAPYSCTSSKGHD